MYFQAFHIGYFEDRNQVFIGDKFDLIGVNFFFNMNFMRQ